MTCFFDLQFLSALKYAIYVKCVQYEQDEHDVRSIFDNIDSY